MLEFFNSSQFMPHGMCLLWRADLLTLHVLSDAFIAIAYFSIPIALIIYVRKRPSFQYGRVLAMFAAFILLCGATHVVSIWTFWNPDYAIQGMLKAATALVSVATAVMLRPLLPQLLAMPTLADMNAVNTKLEAEIVEHGEAERRYRELANNLELQVAERTQGLQDSLRERMASEYRFRGAFDFASNGKAISDLDGKWERVNRALCELFGYSETEMLELGWQGLTHPEDLEETNRRFGELTAGTEDSYRVTKRYIAKDGSIVHTLAEIRLVRNNDDSPLFYISDIRDLTELVGLEAAIQHSEARWATVIESAVDAIFELDADGTILSCNPAATRIMDTAAHDLIGAQLDSLLVDAAGKPIGWRKLLRRDVPDSTGPGLETKLYAARTDDEPVPVAVRTWHAEFADAAVYSAIVRDISSQIEAERALHKAHEDLRFQMSNSPLAVIEWGRGFDIAYWSPAAERLFGWTSEQMVGRKPEDWRLVHEDDADAVAKLHGDLISGSVERVRAINRNYRNDGSVIHCEWFNSVRRDDTGKVISILSFVEDITPRVEAQSALMRSEAHTKAMLETAVDGIVSVDPNGAVLSCNPAMERIFGYLPEEIVGHNVRMLVPVRHRSAGANFVADFARRVTSDAADAGQEVMGLRKNGEEFPMEISVSEIRTEGQLSFTGFVRDISDRKRFEKEILEGNELLQQQDWLLAGHTALSKALQGDPSVPDLASYTLDFLCEYLGAELGAFYIPADGQPLSAIAHRGIVNADELDGRFRCSDIAARAAKSLSTETIELAGAQTSMRVHSAFGDINLDYIVAYPIVREGSIEAVIELGAISGLHSNHLDFLRFIEDTLAVALASADDRDQLESLLSELQQQAVELKRRTNELDDVNQHLLDRSAALEEKNEQLEAAKREIEQKAEAVAQANRYKSEFLANMSHELRTPLNSMLVLSRSLAENASNTLSGDDVDCARVINRSGNHLLALINDILDLSKVEAGKMSLELAGTRIGDVMDTLAEQFEPIARDKNLDFDVVCSAEVADSMLITDSMRLQQILRNLLSNAFKFTDAGSVTLAAGTSGTDDVEFRVTDTGIGIAQSEQAHIFDAFRQVDGTTQRRHEGTGLGLSISRELSRLLGARVNIDSAPGHGCTFTVTLPRVHAEYAANGEKKLDSEWHAPTVADSRGPTVANQQSLPETRILIVSADYRHSFSLSRRLGERGAVVEIADCPDKASRKLGESGFDIALVDTDELDDQLLPAFIEQAESADLSVITFQSGDTSSDIAPSDEHPECAGSLDLDALFERLASPRLGAA